MNPVETYIHDQPKTQREIMDFLDQMLMGLPGMTSKIKFKIPFYYRKSWICYLNPVKKGGVEFAFVRGNELSNEQGILDAKGRKQVRGITFFSVDKISIDAMREVIMEAIILDETVPYAGKR